MPNELLFYLLAAVSFMSATAATLFKRPIDSAFSFLITLLSLAALFALLHQTFLFAAQIILYAGAILTLILFIIMFLNINDSHLPNEPNKVRLWLLTLLIVAPFSASLIYLVSISPLQEEKSTLLLGDITRIGTTLFSHYLIAFELISILLLSALIGAIVLAFKPKPASTQENS